MKFKDYLIAVLFLSLIVLGYLFNSSTNKVELSKYVLLKDSLAVSRERNKRLIKSINDSILFYDSVRLESTKKVDSLIEYQNKIHVYYDKKINSFRSISDDSVYGALQNLIR